MYPFQQEENIKKIFYSDVREKKTTGYGGYHKKRGSKSKKCSLPSDNLTERGWKKMNGPVTTVNMNAPMGWEEFKALRSDLKEQYLKGLVDRFGATKAAIADGFNVSVVTLTRHTGDIPMSDMFRVGKKMKAADRDAFNEFFGIGQESDTVYDSGENVNDSDSATEDSETAVYDSESVVDDSNSATEESETATEMPANMTEEHVNCSDNDNTAPVETERKSKFAMSEFSIEFKGAFDADHVANSLRHIIAAGTPVKLKISCDVLEE